MMVFEIKDVDGNVVASIPDNLKVGWSLDLEGTKITKDNIPKHLQNKCTW